MEIILSEKQLQIIRQISEQQSKLSNEFNILQSKLDTIVELILDTKGLSLCPGIQFVDNKLVVPETKLEIAKDTQPTKE